MTVSQRFFNESALKSHKPAHNPCFTIAMEFKCLDFVLKYGDWTAELRDKVLFSDHLLVEQYVVRTRHVGMPPLKRFDEKYTVSTTRHPPSQKIFGAT